MFYMLTGRASASGNEVFTCKGLLDRPASPVLVFFHQYFKMSWVLGKKDQDINLELFSPWLQFDKISERKGAE
jgi:hypothetical protein